MAITLPSWADSLHSHQVVAIQEALDAFQSGAQVVLLDAPTGSGKTLIGEMVRQNMVTRGLYLCHSLALQAQFCKDFPDAALVMGRSNYSTADSPSRFPDSLTAGDCTKQRTRTPACPSCDPTIEGEQLHCRWCHPVTACPYESAKATTMQSSIACTNTTYFLYEANYVGSLPLGRGLIIIDEADTLEDTLMSFVEVSITERRAKRYGIKPPAKKTVESAWVEWAQEAEAKLRNYRVPGDSVEAIRERNSLLRLRANIQRLNHPATGLSSGGWVYTGYGEGNIAFKPIEVNHLAHDFLWKHCRRWLLMSATTISFEVMADTLGLT